MCDCVQIPLSPPPPPQPHPSLLLLRLPPTPIQQHQLQLQRLGLQPPPQLLLKLQVEREPTRSPRRRRCCYNSSSRRSTQNRGTRSRDSRYRRGRAGHVKDIPLQLPCSSSCIRLLPTPEDTIASGLYRRVDHVTCRNSPSKSSAASGEVPILCIVCLS
ncbi:hypothetical protein ElyMa_003591300 [Elysia marginata]|uniref:Uncharacterized protein n=1 Tax=Elysia marginata TaxID=1093978 RepID=A0AAV4EP58_9GAST|nr:hypothetical protein ElyMa_003591300 [Elysia marginata]